MIRKTGRIDQPSGRPERGRPLVTGHPPTYPKRCKIIQNPFASRDHSPRFDRAVGGVCSPYPRLCSPSLSSPRSPQRPRSCPHGTMAPPKQAIVDFVKGHDRSPPAPTSCRPRRASPRWTRTVRCGSRIQCIPARQLYCSGSGACRGRGQAGAGQCRAVQDGAVGRPRGDLRQH